MTKCNSSKLTLKFMFQGRAKPGKQL